MDDTIVIALIATIAALVGYCLKHAIELRKARSVSSALAIEILKERIDRIEQAKKEHSRAERVENEEIKAANDAPSVVALGAMAAEKIGRRTLEDFGYMFPQTKVQELTAILKRIDGFKRSAVDGREMGDENPVELCFRFNDEIRVLFDDELRSLFQKVDQILSNSVS